MRQTTHKKILITSVFLLALAPLSQLNDYSLPYAEHLTFSNTQAWGENYYATAVSDLSFSTDQLNNLKLPPPPSNSSMETLQELQYLHENVVLRTPPKVEQIINEQSTQKSVYGTEKLELFVNHSDRPYTTQLLDYAFEKIGPVILWQKLQFDRIRPSHLDPSLTTAIEIPAHPSYPSGHATQSRITALILSTLDPVNTALYSQSATRIGVNREIAGLHYASDTKAGVLLANQLFPLLMEEEHFSALLNLAQSEW